MNRYEKPYQKIIDDMNRQLLEQQVQDIDRKLRKQIGELEKLKQAKMAIQFTNLEKILLQSVHTKFKYIVRDASGQLFIYENEPHKVEEYWYATGDGGRNTFPYNHLFGEVQWTNQKPIAFR